MHLTVAGYLDTAGRALPVPRTASRSMLAGWDPDLTCWLQNALTGPVAPTDWARADDPPSWEPIAG